MKEYKIGEIVKKYGNKYIVKEFDITTGLWKCSLCGFNNGHCDPVEGSENCFSQYRSDNKEIYFEELVKNINIENYYICIYSKDNIEKGKLYKQNDLYFFEGNTDECIQVLHKIMIDILNNDSKNKNNFVKNILNKLFKKKK